MTEAQEQRITEVARTLLKQLHASGDERFVANVLHGLVMLWIDERVISFEHPAIDAVSNGLAALAGQMRRRRQALGLSPTVTDPPKPKPAHVELS